MGKPMGILQKLKGWRTVILNTLTGLPAAFYALYLEFSSANIDITPVIPQKYVAWVAIGWSVLGVILRLITNSPVGSSVPPLPPVVPSPPIQPTQGQQ